MLLLVLASKEVKKRGKLVLLVLVLSQMTLVAMKADGWLGVSWQMILLPLIPSGFLSLSSLVFILVYSLILWRQDPQSFFSKQYTLLFLVCSLLGLTTIQAVVLAYIYLMLSLSVVATVAMVMTFTVASVLGVYCHEIALAFCRFREVVGEDK
jgi:O-antigen ligase